MDTSTSMAVRTEASGRPTRPRRLRTLKEKQRILVEASAPGASVAEVARRHGLNANLIFSWRRQQEQGVLGQHTRTPGVKLLPVQVCSEVPEPPAEASTARPAAAASASEGRIEITLADGVRIVISGAVSAEQLHHVLAVLR